MTSKPRGRPVGTSPKKAQDDVLLLKAAEMLVRLQVGSPSAAFKKLVGEDNDVDRRRLQRRWSSDGDTFINKAQEPFFHERWEKEAKAFKEAAPELFEKFRAFSESKGGSHLLREEGSGDKPIHFMSLGIVKLNELLKQHSMQGVKKAEEEFNNQYNDWCSFGFVPDVDFLRSFGKQCLDKADQIDAGKVADSQSDQGGV